MINNIISQIIQADKIGIIAHDSPDGDAIGSSLALDDALKALGKQTKFIVSKNINENYVSLIQDIPSLKNCEYFDLLFILDCSDFKRIKNINCEYLSSFLICIDHHTDSGVDMGDICWRENVQATGVLIYQLLQKLPDYTITPFAATMLFLSIKTDTNDFNVFNPNFDIFKMASELISYGADMNWIKDLGKKNLSYLNLVKKLLPRLVYHGNTGIAYLVVNKYDLEQNNSNYTEASCLVSLLENIRDISVIYLIIKNGNTISIKARSDIINVSKIMKCYGGGGHKNAAGMSNYKCRNLYRFLEDLINKTKKSMP